MKKSLLLLSIATLVTTGAFAAQKKIVATGRAIPMIPEMQQAAPNVTFVVGDPQNLVSQVADADAILGTISPELFRAAKNLKWVHIFSAGVETFRFPEFINSNVTLTNGKIIQGPEISDHAFALLLSLTRGLNKIIPRMPKEEWKPAEYKAIELRGKTAVVIG